MSDKSTAYRLAVREIHGHVTVTRNRLTAWYVLTPQRWAFRTDQERYRLTMAYANQIAALSGHEVTIRVTDRPYPAKEWAKRLHDASPNALPGWTDSLIADQRLLVNGTASKVTFIGVQLPTRGRFARPAAYMRGISGAGKEIRQHTKALNRIGTVVSASGMTAQPATTAEVEWLLHRSVRLGLPVPKALTAVTDEPWSFDDMGVFTDDVTHYWDAWSPTVRVEAVYDGPTGRTTMTRHVSILTLGRVPPLLIPSPADPWLQTLDRFPFPTEVLSRFRVFGGPEVKRQTEGHRLRIRNQQKHYAEHDIEEPLDLESRAQRGRQIEDEVTNGDAAVAARGYGWHRIAIAGDINDDSPDSCLERVEEVRAWYAETYRMRWEHPTGRGDAAAQFPLFTEFAPGASTTSKAYFRRLPVRYVAAALPHAASSVGDDRGPLVAHTASSSRRAVHLDPHYAMEVAEAAGLVAIVGNQGAGKSTLMGDLVHDSIRRGITTTVLDPANLLAKIATVPDVAGHVEVRDIITGEEGSLSPYAATPDPVRGNYTRDDDDGYQGDLRVAAQDRKALTRDIIAMLLDDGLKSMNATGLVVAEAVRRVPPTRTSSLWDVVEQMGALDDPHGRVVADYLREMADMPLSRLFFSNNREDVHTTATGLIIAMHGLQLPEGGHAPRTTAERLSVPILHLATHLATSRVYGLPRTDRKMLALDEVGLLSDWASGRSVVQQLGRNTRKWNLAAILASQNGSDILGMDIANFLSTAFVGRTEDEDVAAENLRLLGVKPGHGYEAILMGLSELTLGADDATTRRGPREFVMRDVFRRVERIRVDLTHKPDLLRSLYTTPGNAADDQTLLDAEVLV